MFKFVLRLSDDEGDLIKSAAAADSRSINSWCKLALLDRIRGTKPITTTLLPGQDIIVQNRSNSGKFVKRSK